METEKDIVSNLLAIGEGGSHFFMSCLLHLSPEELKACRLVNSTWDKVINGFQDGLHSLYDVIARV